VNIINGSKHIQTQGQSRN